MVGSFLVVLVFLLVDIIPDSEPPKCKAVDDIENGFTQAIFTYRDSAAGDTSAQRFNNDLGDVERILALGSGGRRQHSKAWTASSTCD